jgi:hypothetical protein
VLDYMVELMVLSIYRIWGCWLVNWSWRSGGRRGGRALASRIRGVHWRNGSMIVLLSVPRLLPHSNKPRRGATEVTGVSTTTLVVWPRRNGYRRGDKLQSTIKSTPFLIFSPSRYYASLVLHKSLRSARILARRSSTAR